MENSSILIINFEGIIGEVAKIPLFDIDGKFGLWLKHGVVEGISKLMKKFRVVLMANKPYQDFGDIW